MTIAYWSVLAAALLPYVLAAIAKSDRRYDNHAPRDWLARLDGHRARAHAAQLNGFETFPAFAAGVVIAHLTGGAEQHTIDLLAVLYLVFRVGYNIAYLTDRAATRSIVWFLAQGAMVGLYVAAA